MRSISLVYKKTKGQIRSWKKPRYFSFQSFRLADFPVLISKQIIIFDLGKSHLKGADIYYKTLFDIKHCSLAI